MDNEQEKKLKALLRGEFLPLFIGLRNELKGLYEQLGKLIDKEPPAIQKAEITNQPEPIRELAISNLPDVQKVEVLNQQEQLKELEIKGLTEQVSLVIKTFENKLNDVLASIRAFGIDIGTKVVKVDVQNNTPPPKTIRVENLAEIKQEPIVFPSSIKISNYAPQDAVPVILTSRDRKKFYEAFNNLYVANDVNLKAIIDAIKDIDISGITVDLSDIENLITDTNEILADILIAIQGGTTGTPIFIFNELSVSATTELTICSYTCPVGKTFELTGVFGEGVDDGIFRLYKNADKVWQARNSWSQRNVQSKEVDVHLAPADVLYLKVYNTRNQARDYSGGIYGNTV